MRKSSLAILLLLCAACSNDDLYGAAQEPVKATQATPIATEMEVIESEIEPDVAEAAPLEERDFIESEELKNVLANSFSSKNIKETDSYPIANEKSGKEAPQTASEGGFCSQYEDYSLCRGHEEDALTAVILYVNEPFTAKDLKQITGQDFELFQDTGYSQYPGTAYFLFEDKEYYVEFDGLTNDAQVEEIFIKINKQN